jgi:hypothetical protein
MAKIQTRPGLEKQTEILNIGWVGGGSFNLNTLYETRIIQSKPWRSYAM